VFNIGTHGLWKWDHNDGTLPACCRNPYLPSAITGVNEIHNPCFASVLQALFQMALPLSEKPLIIRLFTGEAFVMFERLLHV